MTRSRATSNKFCRATDLNNEASVEFFFVVRLLKDLGYTDKEIVPKRAIQELRVPRGRQKENYKPDFLLECKGKPRWLIDAKSTDENIDEWTHQPAGYSLLINRKYRDRPLRFYVLSNGFVTRVYAWDQEEPLLSLRFEDFADGKPRYEALKQLLKAEAVRAGWSTRPSADKGHLLTRPSMDVVKRAFLRCHRVIWKSEKMSPQAAFVEFAKLLFVKLWEDRRLRDDPQLLSAIGSGDPLPLDSVRFSARWIKEQEHNTANPVDAILFRQLVEQLEQDIAQRKRKRIFEPNERLALSPGTTRRVVEELERYYLFGIDEDLNGRMFEAFLAATMRGQALGQYFTPRSVVKLMTRLASPSANRGVVERVLDGCCGTGGFLIEALTEMRGQIYKNTSLSKSERGALLDEVANQAIFGIDAGRDPPIARIARINMYLHGDGGSRVYMADALRKHPEPSGADTLEVREEVKELASILDTIRGFHVVLTNPPFSMDYSLAVPDEAEILAEYDLATASTGHKKRLRSSVMFLERYWDLLQPGGRLLTVMDDSVFSNKTHKHVRRFIRERFIVRAIISLHGDAFQRSGARAKTSILFLVKRHDGSDIQPDVFVYESRYVGLDDVVPKTPASMAELARARAIQEIEGITRAFNGYLQGEANDWLVSAERLDDRLDAKHLRPWSVTKLANQWRKAGAKTVTLEELVESVEAPCVLQPNKEYTFIRVTYAGACERGERRLGKEITYSTIHTAHPGDVVVSGMGAVYRAICVLPPGSEDLLISNEYTILRLKEGVEADPMYLWSILRSAAVVAEWLSQASGLSRHRVDWDVLRKQRIPLLPYARQKQIGDKYRNVLQHEAEIARCRQEAAAALDSLDLEGDEARAKLDTAKPPR